MTEFIDAILSPVNLVLSVLLALCFGYWLMVCFGAVDIDSLDIDLDIDTDVDIDVDAGHHAFPAMSLLRFFNLGELPLMVLLSVFTFILWATGVVTYRYIGEWGILLQLLLLLPMILGAALLTKFATAPLKRVFNSLEASQSTGEFDFIGQRCFVVSMTIDDERGQVEVKTDGSPIKLNARLDTGERPLPKGSEVVVLSHDPDTGVYRVRGF